MLYLSRSATGVTVVVALVLFVLALNDLRSRGNDALRWILPVSLAVFTAVIGAWSLLEVSGLTRILGRDSSLTGRMDLWSLVVEAIGRRPWLGYGYQAFWVTPGGPADGIRMRLPFTVPHAHDGFLDVWLEIGAVGLPGRGHADPCAGSGHHERRPRIRGGACGRRCRCFHHHEQHHRERPSPRQLVLSRGHVRSARLCRRVAGSSSAGWWAFMANLSLLLQGPGGAGAQGHRVVRIWPVRCVRWLRRRHGWS